MNAHGKHELQQLQSLPLEYKIELTRQRIEVWYRSWTKFEIFNEETGKTRFATIDTREYLAKPKMKPSEYVLSEEDGQVYVSFSGGKDSTVLKHIVDSMYSNVPAVFVNTGLEYPEIQKFVRDIKAGKYECFNSDVEIIRPEMRFDEVLKKHGYPVVSKRVAEYVETARRCPDSMRAKYLRGEAQTKFVTGGKWAFLIDAPFRSSAQCCGVMKKKPLSIYKRKTHRMPFLGTLASESNNRELVWMMHGCNAFEAKNPTSQPLSFWTEQDILHYIKKYDVPYAPVYGDIRIKQKETTDQMNLIDVLGEYEPSDILETSGCDRTGCIFCMFGCHLEKDPNRFQRLKQTHQKQWEYCINGGEFNENGTWQPNKEGLGLGYVLDYIGVDYE